MGEDATAEHNNRPKPLMGMALPVYGVAYRVVARHIGKLPNGQEGHVVA